MKQSTILYRALMLMFFLVSRYPQRHIIITLFRTTHLEESIVLGHFVDWRLECRQQSLAL